MKSFSVSELYCDTGSHNGASLFTPDSEEVQDMAARSSGGRLRVEVVAIHPG